MLAETVLPMTNQLMEKLPLAERNRTMDCCEQVELFFGDILCEPDQAIAHVYFPQDSFISLLATVEGHEPLEMGLIGSEGMLGVTTILGEGTAPLRAMVQGTGMALRMTIAAFRQALQDSPELQRILHLYLYVQMKQLSQTAACTHFHFIEKRLARWLLMTHDRAHSDHFHLTHAFLAGMLGVRRSAVTIAAGSLQKKNLIAYSRGEITVLDRKGLEAASCECYQIVRTTYARLFDA